MNKKMLISAAAAAAMLFGVSACGDNADSDSNESSDSKKSSQENGQSGKGNGKNGKGSGKNGKDSNKPGGANQQAAPKPDLKDVPSVVAEVNGEKISKNDFVSVYKAQFQQQAMMGGGKVDQDKMKKQTANGLVESELLVQEATKKGFKASEKDVDNQLKSMAQQNQMKPKQFLQAMGKQGMNEKQVRDQLKNEVQMQGFIEQKAGNIKPSEKELRSYYDQMVQQQKQQGGAQQGGQQGQQKIPPFKDVKDQLEQKMVGQEQSKVAAKVVKGLKKDASIKINL